MVEVPEKIWPERLTLRDSKVYADEGQRIFTTATGYGYEKQEYLRADIAERQIAELRAERDKANAWAKEQHAEADRYAARVAAAEAENARLRALPLKDEVERAIDRLLVAYAACNGEDHPAYVAARALLSRLRAGEQEGWQQCGWAYQDKQWDEGRWHVCGMDSTPRERNGRLVQPIYVAASPSVSDGGSRNG